MAIALAFGFLASVEVAILAFMQMAGNATERRGPHSRAARSLFVAGLLHIAWTGFLTLLAAAHLAQRFGG